jgi:hypothetical protein
MLRNHRPEWCEKRSEEAAASLSESAIPVLAVVAAIRIIIDLVDMFSSPEKPKIVRPSKAAPDNRRRGDIRNDGRNDLENVLVYAGDLQTVLEIGEPEGEPWDLLQLIALLRGAEAATTTSAEDKCNISSASINNYLKEKRSPMVGQGANFMATGGKYNLDPRLLVSLAGAETTFGTKITAGQFNALNVLYNGLNSPFSSWRSNINAAGRTLTRRYDPYDLTSTSTMFAKYCSGPACAVGLQNLNIFMTEQKANVNALRYPCNRPKK